MVRVAFRGVAVQCPNGHEVSEGARFCVNCGFALTGSAEAAGRNPSTRAPGSTSASVGAGPTAAAVGPAESVASARPRRRWWWAAAVVAVVIVAGAGAAMLILLRPESASVSTMLISRSASGGGTSVYVADDASNGLVRGNRVATGSLLTPTVVPASASSAGPIVTLADGAQVFASIDSDGLVLSQWDEGTATEFYDADVSDSVATYLPDRGLLLVSSTVQGDQAVPSCMVVAGLDDIVERDGSCLAGTSGYATVQPADTSVEFTRFSWDGEAGPQIQIGDPSAQVTGDIAWAFGVDTDSGQARLVVTDLATGEPVHESEPGDTVQVLTQAAQASSLVYAVDTGEGEVSVVWLDPTGTPRTLVTTATTTAAVSRDGASVWYTTGSTDRDRTTLFRQAVDDQQPIEIGAGDNLRPIYVEDAERLLVFGTTGESTTDVYTEDDDGRLVLITDQPDAVEDRIWTDATGGVFVSLSDTGYEDLDAGETARLTGVLLHLPANATEATLITDEIESVARLVTTPDAATVAYVISGREDELKVWDGTATRDVDEAFSIDGPTLGPDNRLYYSSTDPDGTNLEAKTAPLDGSESPTTELTDVRWTYIPSPANNPTPQYPYTPTITAAIDLGAQACNARGARILSPGDSVQLTESTFCVYASNPNPDVYGEEVVIELTATQSADLTMQLYSFTEDGQSEYAYSDDDGTGLNPLVSTFLERGTYLAEVNVLGSAGTVPPYQVDVYWD